MEIGGHLQSAAAIAHVHDSGLDTNGYYVEVKITATDGMVVHSSCLKVDVAFKLSVKRANERVRIAMAEWLQAHGWRVDPDHVYFPLGAR